VIADIPASLQYREMAKALQVSHTAAASYREKFTGEIVLLV
jgi:hypothetical protein